MHAFQHSWCPRAPPPLPPRYGRTVRYGLPGSKGEPHTGNRWSPEDSRFPETTGFAENDGLRNPVVSGFPRFPVTSSLRNPVTRVKFVHFKQSISNIRNEYNYTWTRIDIQTWFNILVNTSHTSFCFLNRLTFKSCFLRQTFERNRLREIHSEDLKCRIKRCSELVDTGKTGREIHR